MKDIIIVDLTRTQRYKVELEESDFWSPYTNKYDWAVGTGRFEGTIEEFAAHLGEYNSPESKCTDYGYNTRKIKVISRRKEGVG